MNIHGAKQIEIYWYTFWKKYNCCLLLFVLLILRRVLGKNLNLFSLKNLPITSLIDRCWIPTPFSAAKLMQCAVLTVNGIPLTIFHGSMLRDHYSTWVFIFLHGGSLSLFMIRHEQKEGTRIKATLIETRLRISNTDNTRQQLNFFRR